MSSLLQPTTCNVQFRSKTLHIYLNRFTSGVMVLSLLFSLFFILYYYLLFIIFIPEKQRDIWRICLCSCVASKILMKFISRHTPTFNRNCLNWPMLFFSNRKRVIYFYETSQFNLKNGIFNLRNHLRG